MVTWEEAAALCPELEAANATAKKGKSIAAVAAKKARAAATESALHQLDHAAGQNRYDDGTFQAKPAANATPRTCPANNKRKHLDWTSKKGSKTSRSASSAVYYSYVFVYLYTYLSGCTSVWLYIHLVARTYLYIHHTIWLAAAAYLAA